MTVDLKSIPDNSANQATEPSHLTKIDANGVDVGVLTVWQEGEDGEDACMMLGADAYSEDDPYAPDPAKTVRDSFNVARDYWEASLTNPDCVTRGDYPCVYLKGVTDPNGTGDFTDKDIPWFHVHVGVNFSVNGENQYPSAADVGSGRSVFHLGWATVLPAALGSGVNGWTMYADGTTANTRKKVKWAVPGGRRRGASAPMGTLFIDVSDLPPEASFDNDHLVVINAYDYCKITITGYWPMGATKRVILPTPYSDVYEDEYQVLVDNATSDVITMAGAPTTGATCTIEPYSDPGSRRYVDVIAGGCQYAEF